MRDILTKQHIMRHIVSHASCSNGIMLYVFSQTGTVSWKRNPNPDELVCMLYDLSLTSFISEIYQAGKTLTIDFSYSHDGRTNIDSDIIEKILSVKNSDEN